MLSSEADCLIMLRSDLPVRINLFKPTRAKKVEFETCGKNIDLHTSGPPSYLLSRAIELPKKNQKQKKSFSRILDEKKRLLLCRGRPTD